MEPKKLCAYCNNFFPYKRSRDKYCAECRNIPDIYVKMFRKNHPERVKESRRNSYKKNREKEIKSNKAWKIKNYERFTDYHREYYQKHREKCLEYARKKRAAKKPS